MSETKRVSTTQNTGNICCPFFIAHGKREIVCEGLIDGSKNWTRFDEAEEKTWHQCTYCEGRYTCCEVYRSIMHWRWSEEEMT